MRRTVSVAVFVLLFCIPIVLLGNGSSQRALLVWEPPRLQVPETLPRPALAAEIVSRLRVAGATVVLERTSLKDAARSLGGKIGQRGDASEYLEWLCLSGADANSRWALWLESSEIGGGLIDGFAMQRLEPNAMLDHRCVALKQSDRQLELPIALQLGMTETQVIEILGRPALRYRNTLIYNCEHQAIIRKNRYSIINTVYVVLRSGTVSNIQVWKDTSS